MPLSSLSANGAGALFGLAAYATFSTHDLVVKMLGATYSPFQIVFLSALLSFPLITLLMIRDTEPGTLRPVHPWWMAVRSLSGTGTAICVFYAFSVLPLAQVYAFIFAMPLLITLMAIPMLGEVVRLRRGLAVAVGLIGVMIVLRPGASPLTPGHIAALAAAVLGALNSVIVRKIGNDERSVVMVLYPMLCNLAVTAIALPFVYVPVAADDLLPFAVVATLVLIAMMLLVAAYRRGDAIVVAPTQYSQMIWATIFGIALFGEYPEWQTWLGTGVIVLSGLYILKRETIPDVSRNAPVSRTRTRPGHTAATRVGQMLRRKKPEDD